MTTFDGDDTFDLTPEQIEAVTDVLIDHDERIAREAALDLQDAKTG